MALVKMLSVGLGTWCSGSDAGKAVLAAIVQVVLCLSLLLSVRAGTE